MEKVKALLKEYSYVWAASVPQLVLLLGVCLEAKLAWHVPVAGLLFALASPFIPSLLKRLY